MRRKFLSVVFCVCMMLTMVPFAFAEGDSGDSTNDNVSSGSGTATQAVAQIDNTTYNTLSKAIAAAENGKTITLLSNTSGQVKIPTNKDITLDLNGNTITHTGTTVYNLGKLTIRDSSNNKSGKIISTGNVGVGVGHNSTTTIEYANIEAVEGAVITGYATGATITINDGNFSASDNAVIAGNGNNTDDNATGKPVRENPNKINIHGGTFTGNIKTNGYIACGIYAPWKDIITVSGGNFTVNNGIGIVARAGQVIVTGGSFTCNGTAKGKVGDKNFDMDAAQSVYFDASDPAYPAYNSETDYIKLLGGTFSSDVTSYVAENYTCIQNNGEYTVKPLKDVAVAKIGDILYPTLAKAIEAVPNNDESATTVTLIKDSTEDVTIPATKKVALNLNGKKLTNVSSNTITNNGTLTITGEGTVDNVTHAKAAIYNKGTVTLNGGTYDRSNEDGVDADNAGTNTYYTILNHGNMTVDSSVTVRNKGHHSSLFENGYYSHNSKDGIDNPTLTITSGTYEGGLNTIKNDDDATLIINGGTFTNYTQAAFQNHGTATVTAGSFIANSKYAIDNCGCDATHDPGKLEISGGTFNGTLYIRSAYSNVTISDGYFNGSISETGGTLTITGGYFTSDPTPYCGTKDGKQLTGVASKDSTYPYTVGDKKADSQPATVDSATVPANTTSTDPIAKEAAEKISGATLGNSNSIEAATKNEANNNTITADTTVGSSSTVLDSLKTIPSNSNIQPTDVAIVYQTYVDVTVTDAKKDSSNLTELTVNLTPMYRVVATTKNVTDIKVKGDSSVVDNEANAILIENAKKLNVPAQAYEVTLALPSGFAIDGAKLSIKHIKGSSVEYYTGTVSEASSISEDLKPIFVTFTTNGFSPFVIYAASANVASIGDGANQKVYPTLQAAIDAVKDNETINVTGTGLSATVSGSKTFKVTGQTVNLTAASGYNLTNSGDTYTVSHQSSGGPGSFGGSISTPTTYAVNVNAATNGAVAADKKTASKGTMVTVTASPSKGYVVDAVKVVDKDGKDVAVTGKDGKYVFTMPASAVTVTGSFKAETPAPVALPFTDVKSGNWFYDAVKYAYAQGLMTGTSATTFAPNGTMNRAMIVTVLYRLEKSPAVTGASKFTDVPAGQWYSDAVAWAAANKIVNGYDETTFGPMNAVTREQMAAILFRYEQVKGLENVTLEENLNRFPDQNKISAYAIPALQWAVGQKIINGNADGTLDPTGTATRAQVAQIFTNLLNK